MRKDGDSERRKIEDGRCKKIEKGGKVKKIERNFEGN